MISRNHFSKYYSSIHHNYCLFPRRFRCYKRLLVKTVEVQWNIYWSSKEKEKSRNSRKNFQRRKASIQSIQIQRSLALTNLAAFCSSSSRRIAECRASCWPSRPQEPTTHGTVADPKWDKTQQSKSATTHRGIWLSVRLFKKINKVLSIIELKKNWKNYIYFTFNDVIQRRVRILERVSSSLNDPLDCWRQITFIIFPSPTGPFSFSCLVLLTRARAIFVSSATKTPTTWLTWPKTSSLAHPWISSSWAIPSDKIKE